MDTMLSTLLFNDSRRRVLSLLLMHPEHRYHVREIARLTGTVAGTINKELRKLADAGVLSKQKQGNQLHYQANRDCLIYDELLSILQKTSGLAEVLAGALLSVKGEIETAFVFGSVASGKANNYSDIDVCIVGNVDFTELIHTLYPVQEQLKREINPKCFTREEWLKQRQKPSAFFTELLTSDVINIIGDRDDIR